MGGVQRCPFVKLKADTAGALAVRYTRLKKPLRGREERSVQADTKRRSEVNMATTSVGVKELFKGRTNMAGMRGGKKKKKSRGGKKK